MQLAYRAWDSFWTLRTRWRVALFVLYTYLAFLAGSLIATLVNGDGNPSEAYLDGVMAGGNAWEEAMGDAGRTIVDVKSQCLYEYNVVLGLFEQEDGVQDDFLEGCAAALNQQNRAVGG